MTWREREEEEYLVEMRQKEGNPVGLKDEKESFRC